jgi:hypothetical protein
MKVAKLAPAVALALSIPAAFVGAEDAPPAAAPEAMEAPSTEGVAVAATPEVGEVAKAEPLGPVGHDAQGRPGRIHVVQPTP